MHFLDTKIDIIKIVLACCVLPGMGKTTHVNRPSHGLAFVLKSCKYKFLNGTEIECNYGDCIYLPKNSSYNVMTQEEKPHVFSKRQNVVYCINFLSNNEIDVEPFKIHIKDVDEFVNLYVQAEKNWRLKGIAYEETCRSILYKIVAQLKIIYSKKYCSSKQKQILEPALSYIENNFHDEKISISQLAKMCGVSEVYFRRLFHSEFGVSTAIFIRNKRLNFAKELLESEECFVTDAALMSGFNDIAYFSREFKKKFGIAPSHIKSSVDW